ncbi:MAG: flavin reductase family protein [Acidimicrobiales bacterium]|jgi:flavin reductase (DIM6/NTAB) family NADH-FMN oxidoreductase RutF
MSTRGVQVGPYPDQVDPVEYERLRRRVLWKLPTGLYLLGTRAGERRNLMTMNWAMQVSVDPKHVAVSVEASALSHSLVVEGGCFSLVLVARDNKEVVRKFVKPAVHDLDARTLAGFSYRDGLSGAPIPQFAVGYLDCGLRQVIDVGSHSLFVGEVLDAGFAPGSEEVPVLRMEDTRMSYGG